jgi:hypothetical protein
MPGFAEHAVRRGFAAHKSAAAGFSQYSGNSYSYEHPAVGFGAALKKYEEEQAAAARPVRKHRPPKAKRPERNPIQWPVGSVGKRINYRETPDWKDFPGGINVTSRGRQIGKRVLPHSIALEYFSSQELNAAFTARYSRISQRDDEKGAAARADIVKTFASKLDTLIGRLRNEDDDEFRRTVGSFERRSLMARRAGTAAAFGATALTLEEERFLDTSYEAYDEDDLVTQLLLSREDRLWQPGISEIGGLEGAGPGRLGLRVLDPYRIHRNERRELVRVFSDEFGFQSRFFSRDWTPRLIIATDVGAEVQPRQLRMPSLPIDVALQAPAYIGKN